MRAAELHLNANPCRNSGVRAAKHHRAGEEGCGCTRVCWGPQQSAPGSGIGRACFGMDVWMGIVLCGGQGGPLWEPRL